MKFANYQQHNIAYECEGKGSPIVLLHGFCADSWMWADLKKDLLEEGHQVITIDLPGFGQSDVIPAVTIPQMAEAVQAVVQELKLSPFVLIGHSMGGYVSLAYHQQHDYNIKGLTLFHSHPYADTEETKEKRQKNIDFISRQGSALFVKQLIPQLFVEGFTRMNAYTVDRLIHRAARFQPEGIMQALNAMKNRADQSKTLENVNCPVLFLIGGKETIIPHEWSMKQTTLPAIAHVHTLDKTNHMGMFSAKSTSQKIIREFILFCQ